MTPIIAIDGPAASGKSTTAKLVAERLGLPYLDSGAMYRAVTRRILESGISLDDSEGIRKTLNDTAFSFRQHEGRFALVVDGRDAEEGIRSEEISKYASQVARMAVVRERMVQLQRSAPLAPGLVAEGRDIGTVVFPDADLKIYIDAAVEKRAERRAQQLAEAGVEVSVWEVEADLRRRDENDSSRELSPLRRAEGAVVLDTTELTVEQQVDRVIELVRERVGFSVGESTSVCSTGREAAGRAMSRYYRISWIITNAIARLLWGFRVFGRENIPSTGGVLIAANHLSYMDPPLVGMASPREVHYLAKEELFRWRPFGWLIETYHAIPVKREGADRQAIRRVESLLKAGWGVLVFPEGTRGRTGQLGRPREGVGMLAVRASVPVVPACILGTRSLIACFFKRGMLQVRFGEPIEPRPEDSGDDRRGQYSELTARVMSAIEVLVAEARSGAPRA